MDRIPVNDSVLYALARLVDDSQSETRSPSHSDIEFQIERAKLEAGDPNRDGKPKGKEKRVRAVFSWALEHNPEAAEIFAFGLLSTIRACGGFRPESQNFVGKDSILSLCDVLKPLGVSLGEDGSLSPLTLGGFSGHRLTEALEVYVSRAKKGFEDAALVVGTGKDLMEASAAHVLQELWGDYPKDANFPHLLGQAFTALGFATTADRIEEGEHPRRNLERRMYDLACGVNRLRNKQGTGHGRPWISDLTQIEAKAAIEFVGTICERMLNELKKKKQ